MIKVKIITLNFLLIFCFSNAQEDKNDILSSVKEFGERFTYKLKNGDLSQFKNVTPPEGTWTYEKLIEFRKYLIENKEKIKFGSYVEPSTSKGIYGYNLFAFIERDNGVKYFFAAVISVDKTEGGNKLDNAYLFTEREALKGWWMHTYGFYQGDAIKDIPKKFLYFTCPPPPFKE